MNIFSKIRATQIKGITILGMIILHLFGNNNYKPMFSIYPSFESNLAVFFVMCAPVYLFISGYAASYTEKKYLIINESDIFKKIKSLLSIYWIIFSFFIPLGIIIGKINFDIKEFFLNFITIKSSYNNEWWFVNTYILVMIMFLILRKIKKNELNAKLLSCISVIIWIFGYAVLKLMGKSIFTNLLFSQLPFVMGYIVSKKNIFEYCFKKMIEYKLNKAIIYWLVILILFISTNILNNSLFSILITPIYIYILCMLLVNEGIIGNSLRYFGNHSTNIWLVHTFFCKYYFKETIFGLKYSIFIFLATLILSLGTSNIINYLLYLLKKWQSEVGK